MRLPSAPFRRFNGRMKRNLLLILAIGIAFSGIVFAQTSQLTGKIISVSTSAITVQKGREVWDIKRSRSTRVDGDLKVGSTVTVTYNMPDAQKKEGPTAASDRDPENSALGAQKKE